MSGYIQKLGSDKSYKRPKVTFQEKLTAEQIAEMLQGYEKVDNIADVPLNTHLRYFITEKNGSQIFRTGGFLHNKQNPETYVMLSNGKNVWSVKIIDTVFFKKMTHKEEIAIIHKLYQKKIDEKNRTIQKLNNYIQKQEKQEKQKSNSSTKK